MKKKYDYDEAVAYLEENGIGCDPCQDIEGEYVCDLLDDEVDIYVDDYETYYYQETLDSIAQRAKDYKKEMIEDEEEEE